MILKAQMQTVGNKTVISGLRWYASDRCGLLITVGGDLVKPRRGVRWHRQ